MLKRANVLFLGIMALVLALANAVPAQALTYAEIVRAQTGKVLGDTTYPTATLTSASNQSLQITVHPTDFDGTYYKTDLSWNRTRQAQGSIYITRKDDGSKSGDIKPDEAAADPASPQGTLSVSIKAGDWYRVEFYSIPGAKANDSIYTAVRPPELLARRFFRFQAPNPPILQPPSGALTPPLAGTMPTITISPTGGLGPILMIPAGSNGTSPAVVDQCGETLTSANPDISWARGYGGDNKYWLVISNQDKSKIYSSGDIVTGDTVGGGEKHIDNTSVIPNGLPTDGSTLNVKLYSHSSFGWDTAECTVTAASGSQPPILTPPLGGNGIVSFTPATLDLCQKSNSQLTPTDQGVYHFTWKSALGDTNKFWLVIGNADQSKIYSSGDVVTGDGGGTGHKDVSISGGIPMDGSSLSAVLYTQKAADNSWQPATACQIKAATSQTTTTSAASVHVSVAGSGSVTIVSGSGTASGPVCTQSGQNCDQTYPNNTLVSFNAKAGAGSYFVNWAGECSSFGTSPSCYVYTTSTTKFVVANFSPITISYSSLPVNGGNVSCLDKTTNQTCSNASTVSAGDVILLTTSAGSGYLFTGWAPDAQLQAYSGSNMVGCNSSSATCQFNMPPYPVSITGSFGSIVPSTSANNPLLSFAASPTGAAGIACTDVTQNRSCNSGGAVASGDLITLTATPFSGFYLTGWTAPGRVNSGCAAGNSVCSFYMPSQTASATANFASAANNATSFTIGASCNQAATGHDYTCYVSFSPTSVISTITKVTMNPTGSSPDGVHQLATTGSCTNPDPSSGQAVCTGPAGSAAVTYWPITFSATNGQFTATYQAGLVVK